MSNSFTFQLKKLTPLVLVNCSISISKIYWYCNEVLNQSYVHDIAQGLKRKGENYWWSRPILRSHSYNFKPYLTEHNSLVAQNLRDQYKMSVPFFILKFGINIACLSWIWVIQDKCGSLQKSRYYHEISLSLFLFGYVHLDYLFDYCLTFVNLYTVLLSYLFK